MFTSNYSCDPRVPSSYQTVEIIAIGSLCRRRSNQNTFVREAIIMQRKCPVVSATIPAVAGDDHGCVYRRWTRDQPGRQTAVASAAQRRVTRARRRTMTKAAAACCDACHAADRRSASVEVESARRNRAAADHAPVNVSNMVHS